MNIKDITHFMTYKGFWAMALRYWKVALYETCRSHLKKLFLKDVQRLFPTIELEDLKEGGSGVRAQLVTNKGTMHDDFCLLQTANTVQVLNAPSPGATASLAIGKHITNIASQQFRLK